MAKNMKKVEVLSKKSQPKISYQILLYDIDQRKESVC